MHPEDRRGLLAARRLPGYAVLERRSARAAQQMASFFVGRSTPVEKGHPAWQALEDARLALGHDRRPELRLLDMGLINAWALHGEAPIIVLSTGLMQRAQHHGALSTVMGHELAHLIAGHALGRVQLAMLADLGGLGTLAAGVTGGASLALRRRVMAWIRHGEYSADRAGALAGGVEPSLALMQEMHGQLDGEVALPYAEAFETHPSFAERRRALQAWARHEGAALQAWRELSAFEAAPAERDLDAIAAAELAEFDEDDWDD